jgi:hypothetical protein
VDGNKERRSIGIISGLGPKAILKIAEIQPLKLLWYEIHLISLVERQNVDDKNNIARTSHNKNSNKSSYKVCKKRKKMSVLTLYQR